MTKKNPKVKQWKYGYVIRVLFDVTGDSFFSVWTSNVGESCAQLEIADNIIL